MNERTYGRVDKEISGFYFHLAERIFRRAVFPIAIAGGTDQTKDKTKFGAGLRGWRERGKVEEAEKMGSSAVERGVGQRGRGIKTEGDRGTERMNVVSGSDFKVPFHFAETSAAGNSANRRDEIARAVGGEGGDEDDKEKEEEAERERQEAIREAEERRKEKHRKMEEEREKMRQEIRDKLLMFINCGAIIQTMYPMQRAALACPYRLQCRDGGSDTRTADHVSGLYRNRAHCPTTRVARVQSDRAELVAACSRLVSACTGERHCDPANHQADSMIPAEIEIVGLIRLRSAARLLENDSSGNLSMPVARYRHHGRASETAFPRVQASKEVHRRIVRFGNQRQVSALFRFYRPLLFIKLQAPEDNASFKTPFNVPSPKVYNIKKREEVQEVTQEEPNPLMRKKKTPEELAAEAEAEDEDEITKIKNALDTHIQEIKAQVLEGKCELQ
ncbi:Complexin [Eufriesea mexicana]|nr:Complexin [Eufriesea mexicana]